MKVSKLLAITGLVAVLAITNVVATAFAQYGEPQGQMHKMRQNVDPEVREQVRQAVENNDYATWQELIGQHEKAQKMFENVNADNFYLLNELHQAKENGDFEGAKEIADQLGLKGPMKQGPKNRPKVDPETQEALKNAVESGDYNAWYEIVTQDGRGKKLTEKINAENFYLLNELHQAKQNGDMEKVKELARQLGLERPMKNFGQHVKQFRKGKGIMKKAGEFVQNGDFEGWYDMLTQGNRTPKILEYVNADNFNLLQDLHEARQNGDTEKMEEIRNELGLPLPPGRQ